MKLTTHNVDRNDAVDIEPPAEGMEPTALISTRTDQVTILWCERSEVEVRVASESVEGLEALEAMLGGDIGTEASEEGQF